jgi:hypothetical protein
MEQRVVGAATASEKRQTPLRRIGIPILISLGALLAGVGFGKLDSAALDSVQRTALWIQIVACCIGVIFLIGVMSRIEARQSE